MYKKLVALIIWLIAILACGCGNESEIDEDDDAMMWIGKSSCISEQDIKK